MIDYGNPTAPPGDPCRDLYPRIPRPPRHWPQCREQEADIRETCTRERWSVVEVFTDNDRSASRYARKTRPSVCAARRAAVTRGGCDVVAVWELSRLSRDLGTLVAFRDLCRNHAVRWSVGGRTFDPGDDRDTLPLIVQACQAEGESAMTSKRVRRATTATAQAGRPHGRLTYGYRREYDPTTKAFLAQVIDDDQAAILREIAARFLAGRRSTRSPATSPSAAYPPRQAAPSGIRRTAPACSRIPPTSPAECIRANTSPMQCGRRCSPRRIGRCCKRS